MFPVEYINVAVGNILHIYIVSHKGGLNPIRPRSALMHLPLTAEKCIIATCADGRRVH